MSCFGGKYTYLICPVLCSMIESFLFTLSIGRKIVSQIKNQNEIPSFLALQNMSIFFLIYDFTILSMIDFFSKQMLKI